MARATTMAVLLAMLGVHGARGLAEEWIASNQTRAVNKDAETKPETTAPKKPKPPKPVVKSKVIESAPEVELENGTGDIDAEGKRRGKTCDGNWAHKRR